MKGCINSNEILEYRIRRLNKRMDAILRRLDEMEERMDKRFDGLESQINSFGKKTEGLFLIVADGFDETGHTSVTHKMKEFLGKR